MKKESEPFPVQATRSFGDYLQGAWYTIDPQDGQLMSLLGAGYFSTEGNDNLVTDRFTHLPGETVLAEEVPDGSEMGPESGGDSADGDQPRPNTRQRRSARNG